VDRFKREWIVERLGYLTAPGVLKDSLNEEVAAD
jgi:hypothetical protein